MEQKNWNIMQLQKCLDEKISTQDKLMQEGLSEAGKDYSRFFEWTADELYRANFLRNCYRSIKERVEQCSSVGDLQECLENILKSGRNDLLIHSQARYSTNPMANLAYTLERECTQKLIEDCCSFSHILSMKPPQQDVREKNGLPVKKKSNGLKM